YLYVEVADRNVVYAMPSAITVDNGPQYADRVSLISANPPYLEESIMFAAEAPGAVVTYIRTTRGLTPEPTILAHWQDVPGGFQLESRIPLSLLGTHIGISIRNTSSVHERGTTSSTLLAGIPGAFVRISPELTRIAQDLVQPGTRLVVTDRRGWRIASVGDLGSQAGPRTNVVSNWLRVAYEAFVEPGTAAALASPNASGREQQPYIVAALDGHREPAWFRSADSDTAIVAVAEPIIANGATIGAVVVQQSTGAILSLTNQGLARLMKVTLIATLLVAAGLLGYATWLSRRIRQLSVAAEQALDDDNLHMTLPSTRATDEIGDLSRSFSHVLHQLGDYNDYLRSLASKLSHELRTPLAIVTSSLENLEHEPLNEASTTYMARARDGADRLRRILSAMSEASRVEELMAQAEPELFDLHLVLEATVNAYRDVYDNRRFVLDSTAVITSTLGSPELIIQMLDKLVDNAAEFSDDGDTITIGLHGDDAELRITVSNPGPSLPERMRTQLFDSMVSVRAEDGDKHLGLGLYVARLIAEGHGGRIDAQNIDAGVMFTVSLPAAPG
ncbi:MAG: hypothetical protein IIA78_06605, partial [Proteobacteria bacterium]|nr:hypothetical protein [Pseudomonadota bacterium]